MSSLLNDLQSLINPAPSQFDSDDDDEFDATKAKVVDNFDENDQEETEISSSKFLKKRQKFLDEEDQRYKGSVVNRNDFFDVAKEDDEEEEKDLVDEGNESDSEGVDVEVLDSDDETEPKTMESIENVDETDSTELIRPFSKVDVSDELTKSRAVQNQLKLWEQLLAARIRLQRILAIVNQFPQDEETWNALESVRSSSSSTSLTECKQQIKTILDSLIHFQTQIFSQNETTKFIIAGGSSSSKNIDDDDEILSSPDEDGDEKHESGDEKLISKRIYKISLYPKILAERHSSFSQFRDKTLLYWFEKTRLASGKIGGRNDFEALEKNVLKQIEQILMDKNRLIKRTQLKRSSYTVLGKRKLENDVDDDDERQEDEHDVEIFDDDDFYHQLLRELIERKSANVSDPNSLTRQWLEVQKLRNKAKKKHVDRKASKGRKVRYDVFPKLVNFMAPVDSGKFSEEAKDELFRSLFGQVYSTE